jgi:cell fate (sporulation/competence/biofilm development) regulator YlbF (YheA/YmcA/DUF963 family)
MSKHLARIFKLERRIEDLEEDLEVTIKEKKKLEKRLEYYHEMKKNDVELEKALMENNKLRIELNQLKRTGRKEGKLAQEKLDEIRRILNYNPKGD